MTTNNITPDLSMGLGSAVYALTKLDGRLQLAEMQTVKELLAKEPHGDLALHSFFLRENTNESVEEAYAFAMRRFVNQPQKIDESVKKRFVDILIKVADAHDDTSRKEREFIQRFRRDIRRC